jgi:hypothetical protein
MAGLVLPLADANAKHNPSAFNEYSNGTTLMYPLLIAVKPYLRLHKGHL